MENLTEYQIMWMVYLAGAVGCCLATWLLFRRAGRAWTHFFVITVMVLLLTPYAVESENMVMAPALYTVIFGLLGDGFQVIKPIAKLMLGLWLGALVLSLIYQLLTRNRHSECTAETYYPPEDYDAPLHRTKAHQQSSRSSSKKLSKAEQRARAELLQGEEPIRAIR